MNSLNKPEPDPKPSDGIVVWDWVSTAFMATYKTSAVVEHIIADMQERNEEGAKKYGTPLKSDNGRDCLVDAYQEALDLCAYLGQDCVQNPADDDAFDILKSLAFPAVFRIRSLIDRRRHNG